MVWEQFGLQCSANERRADEASRDVEAWLKCYFMRERVGEQFRGTISGVAPFGVFVTLNDLFVEGLVHVSELGTDYFQFNEAMHELRGERTGQRGTQDRVSTRARGDLPGIDAGCVARGSRRGTQDGGANTWQARRQAARDRGHASPARACQIGRTGPQDLGQACRQGDAAQALGHGT
jgi:ribonuclease R